MVLLLGTVLDNKPVRAFVFSRPKAVLSFISRQDPTLSSDEARDIYLEWLAQVLSGASFECAGKVSVDAMRKCYQGHRDGSRWPRLGVTMTGLARLRSLRELVYRVANESVHGGYVETGVWRGGMSIFAMAVFDVYGLDNRKLYLCDSFAGLPRPRADSPRKDETWYTEPEKNTTLAVNVATVRRNIIAFGMGQKLRSGTVSLVEGFFNDSLPALGAKLRDDHEELAILRLDGDMYDSTTDALYSLYESVAVGGFVIVDDFGWQDLGKPNQGTHFGAKQAVLEFRAIHNIEDTAHAFHNIDNNGAWFRKARNVTVIRPRPNKLRLATESQLTPRAYLTLKKSWEALGFGGEQYDYPPVGYDLSGNWIITRASATDDDKMWAPDSSAAASSIAASSPGTSWCKKTPFARRIAAHGGTLEREKLQFWQAGYVIIRGLFRADEMAHVAAVIRRSEHMKKRVDEIVSGDHGQHPSFASIFTWNDVDGNDIFSKVGKSERILDRLSCFYEDDVYDYHNKITLKYPGIPGFRPHQDQYYWRKFGSSRPETSAVFIAIDNATRENGCLQLADKSHLLGTLPHTNWTSGIHDTGIEPDVWHDLVQNHGYALTSVPLDPGDAIFFTGNTIHASDDNDSDNSRLSMIATMNTRANRVDPKLNTPGHPYYSHQHRVRAAITAADERLPLPDFSKTFYQKYKHKNK